MFVLKYLERRLLLLLHSFPFLSFSFIKSDSFEKRARGDRDEHPVMNVVYYYDDCLKFKTASNLATRHWRIRG